MSRTPFSRLAFAVCLVLIGVGFADVPSARARVTQIVITATEQPAFGGKGFGTVGPYERISGHVTGEVDPKLPLNGIIVDIGLAPVNAKGMVEYSTDFQILRPVSRGKGNRRLLYEITNRGSSSVLQTLNDSRTGIDATASGDPGNGFLMRQGYVVLESGWDVTAPRNGKLFTATVPIVKNPDGSTIIGPAVEEFVIDKGAWDYADAKLDAVKLSSGNFGGPGSFGPTALYEFTYVAKDPLAVGLGFAAIRDLATFLRNAETDDRGTPNPLAGDIQFIYSYCSSQPCRTMHDYVQLGFNQPEHAAGAAPKVFDGVLNWKAGGSGIFMNYRFAQPVRTHRQHIARWTPEYQFPFADQKLTDPVTGKTDSRLRRCEEIHIPPGAAVEPECHRPRAACGR